METRTIRLYKDEYNQSFLEFLKVKYECCENQKTISFVCTTDECLKISSLMYKDEKECKEVFPEFLTYDDEIAKLQSTLDDIYSSARDSILKFIDSPAFKGGHKDEGLANPTYSALHDIAIMLLDRKNSNNEKK